MRSIRAAGSEESRSILDEQRPLDANDGPRPRRQVLDEAAVGVVVGLLEAYLPDQVGGGEPVPDVHAADRRFGGENLPAGARMHRLTDREIGAGLLQRTDHL